jgi:5-methylcytosine-specific restriction endonuclease McrA
MNDRVLVLNQDYQPLSVCSPQRAFLLLFMRKAELVQDLPERKLRSASQAFAFPSVIRLAQYVNVPYRKVSLTRANIFRRDNMQCVYCGSRQMLTIDHVVPRSLGGKDSWDNLVTACADCNTKKANLPLEKTVLKLRYKPFRPSYILYLNSFTSKYDERWRPFLMLT